jgi:hypothetical protein
VCYYLYTTTTYSSTCVQLTLGWTDPAGQAKTLLIPSSAMSLATYIYAAGNQVIATNGTSITYTATVTGGGTGAYGLQISCERIN